MKKVSIDLQDISLCSLTEPSKLYLRFDQDQVDEQHHKVMFDILVAKASTVLADRQTNTVAAGLVIGSGILRVQRLDWIPAFYADGHFGGKKPLLNVVDFAMP